MFHYVINFVHVVVFYLLIVLKATGSIVLKLKSVKSGINSPTK